VNDGELRRFLEAYPDEMPVIYELYSDYSPLSEKDIKVVGGVDKNSYVMRTHPTMSDDNKRREQQFLCFPGN
jgi:hypothetical protein